MNVIQRALTALTRSEQRSNPFENPGIPLSSPAAFTWLSGGHGSSAGEFVNPTTAMQVAAYYSCVKVLAESIGSLTLNIYKRTGTGRQIAYDHNLYDLLARSPNPEMVAQTFWEAAVTSVCLFGNFYAEIERDSKGNIVALWPLLAAQTEIIRVNGQIAYRTTGNVEDGSQTQRVLQSQNVFHLLLNSLDGLKGLSPIAMARETLGRARALDGFSNRFFRHFGTPQLALINKSPLGMSSVDKTRAKEDWRTLNSGENQHNIAILDSDFDIKQLSISQNDMQFLETKAFSRSEICGLLRVPEHFIGSLDRITNSNLETMNRQFLTQTLRPWLSRIEATVEASLLPRQVGQSLYTVVWDTSDFTRGDSAAQTSALTAGVTGGWLSPNEARSELGMNPGGPELDAYRVAVNLMNANLLINQKAPEMEPVPEPVVEGDSDEQPSGAATQDAVRSFLPLFHDAVQRSLTSNVTVSQAFGPTCEALASFRGVTDPQVLVNVLQATERRSVAFTEDNVDAMAEIELDKAVRAITFAKHEAAAKKELSA